MRSASRASARSASPARRARSRTPCGTRPAFACASSRSRSIACLRREHDPEKWLPVFRKDHAQTKSKEWDVDPTKTHPALSLKLAPQADARAPIQSRLASGRHMFDRPGRLEKQIHQLVALA